MKKKPNIIYIHSHDTGRFIQPYGYQVHTPNLQRLAEEGVLFRKAFSVAPTSSPSRAGLLTGMSAHSCGMLGLAHLGWRLNDYRQHLIHTLHAAGYTSALSGIQHIAAPPVASIEEIGYQQIFTIPDKSAAGTADCAIEYINQKREQPFFLSVGFFETHREFPPVDSADDPRYVALPPVIPDTPETRADMAAFKTSARNLDFHIGRILDALDAAGIADDTLIICTTDHGLAMPEMKSSLTDRGTGVYLIMRGAGGFTGGKVFDSMVSHLDIFPTVCELLNIAPPARLQGKSLLPLVAGDVEKLHDELFSEITFHAAYEPVRAVRTERWKYIRRFDSKFKKTVLPNCDDGVPKTVWLEQTGWRENCPDEEQLFDLILDPVEMRNLAGDGAVQPVLDEMRERLRRWMQRTDDPLLNGDVPLPEKGIMWRQDAKFLTEPTIGCDGELRSVPKI